MTAANQPTMDPGCTDFWFKKHLIISRSPDLVTSDCQLGILGRCLMMRFILTWMITHLVSTILLRNCLQTNWTLIAFKCLNNWLKLLKFNHIGEIGPFWAKKSIMGLWLCHKFDVPLLFIFRRQCTENRKCVFSSPMPS